MKKYTKEEIERYLTPAGGYLRKDLEKLGVKWPPKKGWKRRLMEGKDPNRFDWPKRTAPFMLPEEREWEREAWERFE
jgi:hypothetical protein